MKIVNQQIIKETNLKRIYTTIGNEPGISRAQLAKETELSRATVSSLVDELIRMRFVVDGGASDINSIGRRPNMLFVNDAETFIGVVDWTGEGIRCVIIGAGCTIVKESFSTFDLQNWSIDEICNQIDQNIISEIKGDNILLGLCIVVPAMIDPVSKQIISTVINIEENNTIVSELKKKFKDIPVAFLNDTACLAYAEKIFSNIRESNFVYVNIEEGVGATLFMNGEFLRGSNGMATQFGHLSIDRNGPKCRCGNRGCFELMVGENALGHRVEQLAKDKFPESVLAHIPSKEIKFNTVRQAVNLKDECAITAVSMVAEDLAFGLNNLISLYNPELIVLGGRGAQLGDYFMSEIKKNMLSNGFTRLVNNVSLRYAKQNENAKVKGAAKIYLDKFLVITENPTGDLFI